MWRSLIVLTALLCLVSGHGFYRDAMPNGRRIPCGPDTSCGGFCEGFGHVLNDNSNSCSGGGEHPDHLLSKFGNAWQTHNLQWTKGMCMEDSDGDGKTNGDEMGDPCCVWTTGATPSRTTSSTLTNPTRADATVSFPSCSLSAPTMVMTVGTITQTTATLLWNSSSCLCGFNISQITPSQIGNMQTSLVANPVSGSATVLVSALDPGTMYTFQVRGYNLKGAHPQDIMVHTLVTSNSAPAAPVDFKLVSSSSTSLSFSWAAPSTSVDGGSLSSVSGFELDVGAASPGVYSTVYSGPLLEYTVQGLLPETDYVARIKAVNSFGVGLSSSPLTVSTAVYTGTKVSASYTSDDNNFYVGWQVDGDIITFQMTGKTLGYVAVGWGDSPTMSNTDMVVGSFDKSTGIGSVTDLWSSSRDTPAFDVIQDVTFVSGTQNTTHTTLAFTRHLMTNDSSQDINIEKKDLYLVWAIGSGLVSSRNTFAVHTKRGAAKVNFFTGTTVQVSAHTDQLKNAHGALAFLAWGILLPLGSFIARYKRCDMGVWWFRAHVAMQLFGSVLTFIAFIIIVVALGSVSEHFASAHAICGLIMIIITLAQNLLGLYSHLVYNPNRKRVPVFPDRVHGMVGLATLMFGFVTIFLGFQFFHVNLGVWLLGAQCLLFSVTAALVYEFFDSNEKED